MPHNNEDRRSPFLDGARIAKERVNFFDQPSSLPGGDEDGFFSRRLPEARFREWIEQMGGLGEFEGMSRAEVERMFLDSGAFTDRADVPGEPAPPARFAGPRRDLDAPTRVSDLKIPL